MRLYLSAAAMLALALPASAQEHHDPDDSIAHIRDIAAFDAHHGKELATALARENRAQDRARDPFRHPAETLAFFHIGPHMKVGEYAPGGGWYSRVLGNYLDADGKLVGLFFTPEEGVFDAKAREDIRKSAAGFPAQVESWTGRRAAGTQGLTLDTVTDTDKGTFDRIIVMRMMHNMLRWNFADSELRAIRALLKPGGMLGIEQHRAKPNAPGGYSDGTKGYLRQKDVVGLVEAAGFELVAASEINANPRDPANHPGGVWEMKPSWQTKRADLESLGESDRMTLLFRKR